MSVLVIMTALQDDSVAGEARGDKAIVMSPPVTRAAAAGGVTETVTKVTSSSHKMIT